MLCTMLLGFVTMIPILSTGAAVLLEWNVWIWIRLLEILRFQPVSISGNLWMTVWLNTLLLFWLLKERMLFFRRFR